MSRKETEARRVMKKMVAKANKAGLTQNAIGEKLDAYWTIQEYGDFGSDWLTFIRENK